MIPAPWYLAGPLLGLLIVALRGAVNKPFGVLGGYIDLVEHTSQPRRLGISTFLLLGVVLGGALYAALFGVFSPSLSYPLLILPGDLEIYPAHFSGSLCGSGLSGKPTSTMAFERRWNPMLSLHREAFIDALADVPPKPAEMERILALNRGETNVQAGA